MFEFSRELRRFLKPQASFSQPRDGLTGGDVTLLELLDLDLLLTEAKAYDVAAGRIGAKDRPMLQLQQAIAWREVARRTGDAAVLRKAASAAELAASGLDRASRGQAWALARAEQAHCASLGAELFGDDGLNAAAAIAFAESQAAAGKGFSAALAAAGRARIEAMSAVAAGDAEALAAAIDLLDHPFALSVAADRKRGGHLPAARVAADRAEVLIAAGERFKDDRRLSRAITDLQRAQASLDPAYEPLSFVRAVSLRGAALVRLGELIGEPAHIVDGVAVLAEALDHVTRDHSPLDWARVQLALAHGLHMLGEATESEDAFAKAEASFDRALMVLKRQPALGLTASAAVNRAICLIRRAELNLDLFALDEAEAAFRCQLAAAEPKLDPVAWAVCQMSLARIYEARWDITGRDRGERARAAMALSAALDVFAEAGMRSLADMALTALRRLNVSQTAQHP
ncbi:hypothetical protein BH11PSE2_BH11PSE2_06200 [soil metagenome]